MISLMPSVIASGRPRWKKREGKRELAVHHLMELIYTEHPPKIASTRQ
jgi:hypothetical protein